MFCSFNTLINLIQYDALRASIGAKHEVSVVCNEINCQQ